MDILHEIESIESTNQLDVKKYGVVVENGSKRGLLLPNLDSVDTVEQQVLIAKQKAGISGDNIRIYRFQVERHEIKEEKA